MPIRCGRHERASTQQRDPRLLLQRSRRGSSTLGIRRRSIRQPIAVLCGSNAHAAIRLQDAAGQRGEARRAVVIRRGILFPGVAVYTASSLAFRAPSSTRRQPPDATHGRLVSPAGNTVASVTAAESIRNSFKKLRSGGFCENLLRVKGPQGQLGSVSPQIAAFWGFAVLNPSHPLVRPVLKLPLRQRRLLPCARQSYLPVAGLASATASGPSGSGCTPVSTSK